MCRAELTHCCDHCIIVDYPITVPLLLSSSTLHEMNICIAYMHLKHQDKNFPKCIPSFAIGFEYYNNFKIIRYPFSFIST